MRQVRWWFRAVGIVYLLLGTANLYGILVDRSFLAQSLPYADRDQVVAVFAHAWSPFAFELVGIGVFALWASRNPRSYAGAVWLLVWLELLHGVVDDLYLVANGFDASQYAVFMVVHVAIIASGIVAARSAGSATSAAPSSASAASSASPAASG